MAKRTLSIDEQVPPPPQLHKRDQGSFHTMGSATLQRAASNLTSVSEPQEKEAETMEQLVRQLSNSGGDHMRILQGSQPGSVPARLSSSMARPFGSMDFMESLGGDANLGNLGNISDMPMHRLSSLDMEDSFGTRPPIDSQSWTIPNSQMNTNSSFLSGVEAGIDSEQQWREERLEHIVGDDLDQKPPSDMQAPWAKVDGGTVNRTVIHAAGVACDDDVKVTSDHQLEGILSDWRSRRQQAPGASGGESVPTPTDENENLKWLRESSLAAIEAIRSYQKNPNRGSAGAPPRGAQVHNLWNMSLENQRSTTRTTIQAEWK